MTTDNNDSAISVQHRPEERRYVLFDADAGAVIGEESYVDITVDGDTHRVMHHTEVSKDYGGRGLAATLVAFAVDDTIAAGATIVPVCPYVARWSEKHPEIASHVERPRPEHLQAISGS